ncbi:hypothetical protein ABFS82_05G142600 [Erythranthe guttata]|uniref:Uncharacterized protein n=1 Tax=Erythranthe guttata TaxID=4155 RepID=A0A022R0N7_ERYGU|nr:hypothetical protein MIMGU_mgv1a016287mg [Erythranthe guttata]
MGRGITCSVLCFIVLISLVIPKGLSEEYSPCPPKTIEIVQTQTSKTEWKVSVTNTCICTVFNVHLLCPKFESVVVGNKDQSVISEIDKSSKCLLNNGDNIVKSQVITFTYSGDRVNFALDTYNIACS